MVKPTIRSRLLDALEQEGWKTDHDYRSRNYIRLSHPSERHFLFLGTAGALRRGPNATHSFSLTDSTLYKRLLEVPPRSSLADL